MKEILITDADSGQRLDRFLARVFRHVPRSVLYRWIREKRVRINGKRASFDHSLIAGEVVTFRIPVADSAALEKTPPTRGQDRLPPLPPVVFADDALLILDKPAGMAVHGGSDIDADHLTARVRRHHAAGRSNPGAGYRPSPVHRLDRETSGLIVFALTLKSHRALAAGLREHGWRKEYLGLVQGTMPAPTGVFNSPLADKGEGPSRHALAAETRYTVLESVRGSSLVMFEPVTGRFRQIRRHLAQAGLYLAGESRMGGLVGGKGGRARAVSGGRPRLFLHAWRLSLPHPITLDILTFEAPLPPNLLEWAAGKGLHPSDAVNGLQKKCDMPARVIPDNDDDNDHGTW